MWRPLSRGLRKDEHVHPYTDSVHSNVYLCVSLAEKNIWVHVTTNGQEGIHSLGGRPFGRTPKG